MMKQRKGLMTHRLSELKKTSSWATRKTRLGTPFKGDNVKALIKTSDCENFVLYFSEKVQKSATFAMLFGFQWPNNRWKMVLASQNDQKYPRYPPVLKCNVTSARPLRLVIPFFSMARWSTLVSSWQQMKLEIWCGWAHPYKTIAKFILHSLYTFSTIYLHLVSYVFRWLGPWLLNCFKLWMYGCIKLFSWVHQRYFYFIFICENS